MTLGVHFALTSEQERRLRTAAGDDEAVMEVIEAIEEAWDRDHLVETDKAWDAIHRALTDGSLEFANGTYPLSHVILGGQDMHEGDDYIAVLKSANQVREIAAAVAALDDQRMGRLYDEVVPHDYDPIYGPEDRAYTVESFADVRAFYQRAAADGLAVLFTASQ